MPGSSPSAWTTSRRDPPPVPHVRTGRANAHDPGVSHALRQPHFATSTLIVGGDLAYYVWLLDSNLPHITSICVIAVKSDRQ